LRGKIISRALKWNGKGKVRKILNSISHFFSSANFKKYFHKPTKLFPTQKLFFQILFLFIFISNQNWM
jgi:hypothetical protein